MNTPLKVGEMAPDFVLPNQDNNPVRLSDYRGKRKVMLLFYPMDFSPVCTEEHCSFTPQIDQIRKDDETVVFGINADHPFCHAAYRRQFGIPYDLLSDVTRKTLKAYGMFAGEEPFNCAKRGTVVIGRDGKIVHYHEQPILEARKVADLQKAAMVEDLLAQRDNEGGERISASR